MSLNEILSKFNMAVKCAILPWIFTQKYDAEALPLRYFRDLAERRDWLLALPYVTRQRDLQRLSKDCEQAIEYGCKGFLVRNLESFGLLAKKGWAKRCHLDAGLYTYNNRAVDFWRNQNVAADMTPLELNQKEIAHRDNSRSYMLVYGYLPLMVSAQCIQKNTEKCNHAGSILLSKVEG